MYLEACANSSACKAGAEKIQGGGGVCRECGGARLTPKEIAFLSVKRIESIVPRPTAEADDAMGVPRSWREKHHD